jgi:hypothetical protein
MKSLEFDGHNLSYNTHVQSIIYREFCRSVVYIAYEERNRIRMFNISFTCSKRSKYLLWFILNKDYC